MDHAGHASPILDLNSLLPFAIMNFSNITSNLGAAAANAKNDMMADAIVDKLPLDKLKDMLKDTPLKDHINSLTDEQIKDAIRKYVVKKE